MHGHEDRHVITGDSEYDDDSVKLFALWDVLCRISRELPDCEGRDGACQIILTEMSEIADLPCPDEDKCPGYEHVWRYRKYQKHPHARPFYYRGGYRVADHPDMRHCSGEHARTRFVTF
jgi:hypothetical protein